MPEELITVDCCNEETWFKYRKYIMQFLDLGLSCGGFRSPLTFLHATSGIEPQTLLPEANDVGRINNLGANCQNAGFRDSSQFISPLFAFI